MPALREHLRDHVPIGDMVVDVEHDRAGRLMTPRIFGEAPRAPGSAAAPSLACSPARRIALADARVAQRVADPVDRQLARQVLLGQNRLGLLGQPLAILERQRVDVTMIDRDRAASADRP